MDTGWRDDAPPDGRPWLNQVEVVQGRLTRAAMAVEALVSGVDAVIHLAGIMPPAADDEVFPPTSKDLRHCCRRFRPAKKSHAHSSPAPTPPIPPAGAWTRTSSHTENAGQHPTVFYGLSRCSENGMCLYYQEMHEVPIVRLRFVWTLEAEEILDLFLKAPYQDFLLDADRGKRGTSRASSPCRSKRMAALLPTTCAMCGTRRRQWCWRSKAMPRRGSIQHRGPRAISLYRYGSGAGASNRHRT